MKLISYLTSDNEERLALIINNNIVDLEQNAKESGNLLPSSMNEFLHRSDEFLRKAEQVQDAFLSGKTNLIVNSNETNPLAPVPHPTSCRDAYAFRQHVATARRNRGLDMIPEFDQFPVFYFTNHNAIIGEGDLVVESDHLQKLDFELEVAAVIGKRGKNIEAKDADSYIVGLTIMNDFSARTLQMEEMKLNLGPAKGKDFATAIGPWLVTMDELEEFKIETPTGNKYDLRMTAHHNGTLISDGNMKDINWTFAEIIERVSYGVEIFPGDVIGSGTVGTGCYLELNGTNELKAKETGESFEPTWLEVGDTIDLEITGLGKLSNRIVKAEPQRSILAKKKP
ncbi:fumarylacetoacetate hydrolase family protein [candidate division KSB1 bacterium]|nr:fumarylacetoacetate hydrolase family protein [candidate division KSB1 bacterium]